MRNKMKESKEKPPLQSTANIDEIEQLVIDVNNTIIDTSQSTSKDVTLPTTNKIEMKEVIDIEKQGKNKNDAIDICSSVTSIVPSLVPIVEDVSNQIDIEYGNKWLLDEDKHITSLPPVFDEDVHLLTDVFKKRTQVVRDKYLCHDIQYDFLQILFNTLEWVNCEIINSSMKLFNIKAQINKTDDQYYFHNTYRYTYVTLPAYGKMDATINEKRGFRYPKGRNFFSYSKVFLPINQNDEHWTLCVFDIKEKRINHYNSLINEDADRIVMRFIFRYLEYEHMQCGININDDHNQWTSRNTHEMSITVPQQFGSSGDCGLFLILFAEKIS